MKGGGRSTRLLAAATFIAACSCALVIGVGAYRCVRRPKDVTTPPQPVNGRFWLEFSGRDNTYVPGETYRVKLVGARHGQAKKNTFRIFTLFLEPETFWNEGSHHPVGNLSTGGDTLITFGECANTIRQTSGMLKHAIEVLWRAPPSGSGCVYFRATVVEDANLWYMDDEKLTLHLCEEQQMNHNRQPEVQDPCCACDEAKYELTFEGLWSRHSHPKDFPRIWDTRFSDVIGASHAANYSFWKYLGIASPGLRQVAENGTTRMLEKELKDNSQHIRTIIKARGIGYPNVTGKTFAVFRVDRDHHLISVVSHIDPSPDWFVGISGLELCLKNCSWVENIEFDLYPWDAGTNDGITYYLKGREVQNEPIRQITSSYPNNKESPFFDPTGVEMKPMARIYLTRQRLYEKFSCDSILINKSFDCETTDFIDVGECSVTCGRGVRWQQRRYKDPERAEKAECNEPLTKRVPCHNPRCHEFRNANEEEGNNLMCQTTEWSDWSTCPLCGGIQYRQRTYKYEDNFKFCSSLSEPPNLQETSTCDPDPDTVGCSSSENVESESIPRHCELTEWSEWSPCSVTCGNGTRKRARLLAPRDHTHHRIAMMRQDESGLQDEENYGDDDLHELAAGTDLPDCSGYKLTQELHCSGIHEDCDIKPEDAIKVCRLPKDEGPCRMQEEHWYFDTDSESCKSFNYGGCRGNRNNFATKTICEEVCMKVRDYSESSRGNFNGLTTRNLEWSNEDNASEYSLSFPDVRDDDLKRVNCKVNRWSTWSACSVTCGEGYKLKTREILVAPKNNGKPCPKLQKKHKCHIRSCLNDFENEMLSDENPTWGEARRIKSIPEVDCILSEWSSWSPCTKTCGSDRKKVRIRTVLVPPTPNGMPCERRIDHTNCPAIPCPSGITTE